VGGGREDARVPLYQRIRARGMPRRVSINSRRGANSCRWNARWSRREKSLGCVPFVRPATGFPIGDSSLIRRRGVSNRARPNDHLGCVTRLSLHRANHGIAPLPCFSRSRENFGGELRKARTLPSSCCAGSVEILKGWKCPLFFGNDDI